MNISIKFNKLKKPYTFNFFKFFSFSLKYRLRPIIMNELGYFILRFHVLLKKLDFTDQVTLSFIIFSCFLQGKLFLTMLIISSFLSINFCITFQSDDIRRTAPTKILEQCCCSTANRNSNEYQRKLNKSQVIVYKANIEY